MCMTPRAPSVDWQRVRDWSSQLTTPLHADDYLSLVNPLWSSRELRGRVERVIRETDDASTLVIRPGWGWHFEPTPGQYVGIGVAVDGRFHWRSYSLSAPPRRDGRVLAITVRAMPEGFLSQHLVGLAPGTIVRLAAPAGDFVLPQPPPAKLLFFVGGSGITPVMAMLRTLERRSTMPDAVLVYSSPTPERMIFREELTRMAEAHPGLHLHERHTDLHGIFALQQLDEVCPDWRERETWACGPGPMLDSAEQHWQDAGIAGHLHVERFTLELAADGEAGGCVTFQNSGKKAEADGATTVLEAGEQAGVGMPYGCRMGICHTCTLTMISGKVRDLRNGEEHAEPNEPIQTCVTVAVGDCVLNI
jgi:ferredoxin-NADP reductase